MTRIETPEETASRFWAKVRKGSPTQCWIWTASTVNGYGQFAPPQPRTRNIRAHRFSWQLTNGPIPDGMCVCHHCDNPPCVNPSHLFLGTFEENIRDMRRKGRGRSGRGGWGLEGEANRASKLSTSQILEIRSRLDAGEPIRSLLSDYPVGFTQIYRIGKRQTWAWLLPEPAPPIALTDAGRAAIGAEP